jgi:hypothetical protein
MPGRVPPVRPAGSQISARPSPPPVRPAGSQVAAHRPSRCPHVANKLLPTGWPVPIAARNLLHPGWPVPTIRSPSARRSPVRNKYFFIIYIYIYIIIALALAFAFAFAGRRASGAVRKTSGATSVGKAAPHTLAGPVPKVRKFSDPKKIIKNTSA